MTKQDLSKGLRFDLLYSSKSLKKILLKRIKDLKIHPYNLCMDLGISFKYWSEYVKAFNTTAVASLNKRLSQLDLIKISERVGIYPVMTLRVKKIEEVDVDHLVHHMTKKKHHDTVVQLREYDEYWANLVETLEQED